MFIKHTDEREISRIRKTDQSGMSHGKIKTKNNASWKNSRAIPCFLRHLYDKKQLNGILSQALSGKRLE